MTNKAKKLFDFIQSYIQKNGIAPSFDEMKNFMGLKSKSSIFQYLDYLQENKYIDRDKLKSRSIKLKNEIPLYPEISAGKALEADLANIEYVQLENLIKNKSRNSFACKVNGESMNAYGIQNGDDKASTMSLFKRTSNFIRSDFLNSDILYSIDA